MRRSEIGVAVSQVLDALKSAKVQEVLMSLLRDGSTSPAKGLAPALSAFKDFSLKYEHFTVEARRSTSILGLDQLLDANFWVDIVINPNERVHDAYSSVSQSLRLLPKFVQLFNETALNSLLESGVLDSSENPQAILTVLAIENESQFSRPTRIVGLIESIEALYAACAIMLGEPEDGLSLASCDSGSDKSFDFLGAAKVIECVKEIILSIWDRVVFFRINEASARVKLIAESLPVLEHIKQLEEQGKIVPEMAGILRLKIVEGASGFLNAGASIPEIEARVHHDARGLLAPTQRLLARPIEPSSESSGSETETLQTTPKRTTRPQGAKSKNSGLTPEEMNEMRRLFEKSRQSGNDS